MFVLMALLLLLGVPCFALPQVDAYPGPLGIAASDQYRTEVEQDAITHAAFTYLVKSQWKTNNHPDASWASFSFQGRVLVRVTKLTGACKTCRVLPSSAKIKAHIEGNTATFELERPGQFSVEFDDDVKHPMLLFANPPERAAPDPNDRNVLYFGPGVHDLGSQPVALRSNQTVYLAGGAYVYGRLVGAGDGAANVRIYGRGVLSGEKLPMRDSHSDNGDNLIDLTYNCPNGLVDGITLVNAPGYNINAVGTGSAVRNVKCIGWWFSTDGIEVGEQGKMEDCFLMVNDDAIKLYHSNTLVRRCTIWQLENGAPFQISWNMPGEQSGFRVSDCDVIRCEHAWDNDNEAIFAAIHGGSGHMSDYRFEDIRIQNAPWRIWSVVIKPNEFAHAPTIGRITGLTFRNIRISGPTPKRPSRFCGLSERSQVEDVQFENIRINGKLLKSARDANITVGPFTANIRFGDSEPDSADQAGDLPSADAQIHE